MVAGLVPPHVTTRDLRAARAISACISVVFSFLVKHQIAAPFPPERGDHRPRAPEAGTRRRSPNADAASVVPSSPEQAHSCERADVHLSIHALHLLWPTCASSAPAVCCLCGCASVQLARGARACLALQRGATEERRRRVIRRERRAVIVYERRLQRQRVGGRLAVCVNRLDVQRESALVERHRVAVGHLASSRSRRARVRVATR